MSQLDISTGGRVPVLRRQGYSVSQIRARLLEEGFLVSRMLIYKLLDKIERTGSVVDLKSKRLDQSYWVWEHLQFMDKAMADDDKLTAWKLKNLLEKRWPKLRVSISTIKRARKYDLGWIHTRPKYCQLVRVVNRQKRLVWCQERTEEKDSFENVIWGDECLVQLDHHGWLCFRKVKQPSKLKPRPKHSPKVHIWAAILKQGATSVVVFRGILTSTR